MREVGSGPGRPEEWGDSEASRWARRSRPRDRKASREARFGGDTEMVRVKLQPVKLAEPLFIGAHGAAHVLLRKHHHLFSIENGVVLAGDDHAFVSGRRHGLDSVATNAFLSDLLAFPAAAGQGHVESCLCRKSNTDGRGWYRGTYLDEPALLEVAVSAVLDEAAEGVAVYHVRGGNVSLCTGPLCFPTVDADGVALAAIQGLHARSRRKRPQSLLLKRKTERWKED
jgi:hypothetical protein